MPKVEFKVTIEAPGADCWEEESLTHLILRGIMFESPPWKVSGIVVRKLQEANNA